MKHKDKPYWADTMKQAGRDACTLVEENKKAIEVLGRTSYDAGEIGSDQVGIVAQMCPPEKKARSSVATEMHVRPYEGYFRAHANSEPSLVPFIRTIELVDGSVRRYWALRPTTA
jgi:hypothetical protein